jgi:hypothetical protein
MTYIVIDFALFISLIRHRYALPQTVGNVELAPAERKIAFRIIKHNLRANRSDIACDIGARFVPGSTAVLILVIGGVIRVIVRLLGTASLGQAIAVRIVGPAQRVGGVIRRGEAI